MHPGSRLPIRNRSHALHRRGGSHDGGRLGTGVLSGRGDREDTLPGFVRTDGVLSCQGVSLEELAEFHGTPLYVYDAAGIATRVRRFQAAFGAVPFLLAYSVKANGSLALLHRIGALGAGADIVSGGELHRALRAGIPPERIVFAGVGKTEEELLQGLDAGILSFHVESAGELALLAELAARTGRRAPVGVRVNPDVESPTPHAYTRTGHAASKFGVPAGEAAGLYREYRSHPGIEFRGIDVHIGSQIVEPEPYVRALDVVLELVDDLSAEGLDLEYLDLGGGFGVGYDGGPGMDLEALAREVIPRLVSRGLRLVLEPGRSITGESGMLLSRVLYLKESGGKRFIVMDAGMTELIRPSHYGGYHRIAPVRERRGAPPIVADVVGPVCESGDFLALDRPLGLPRPGDLLAFEASGAYGFSMASNYNARRRPAEVLIEGGEALLIRRRERYEDLVRGEEIPDPRPVTAPERPQEDR